MKFYPKKDVERSQKEIEEKLLVYLQRISKMSNANL